MGQWNKLQLFDVVKAYSDRYDNDVRDSLQDMLEICEDRMSRIMRNHNMSAEYTIIMDGSKRYALPDDFAGARSVILNGAPLKYLNPGQAANKLRFGGSHYYTILGDSIQIVPLADSSGSTDSILEIVYYQRVPTLTASSVNWILEYHRDIYKTAMCAEVETFVKNDERADAMWMKLDAMFAELAQRDWKDRWSGEPLSTKLESDRGT